MQEQSNNGIPKLSFIMKILLPSKSLVQYSIGLSATANVFIFHLFVSGQTYPKPGQQVVVHYTGELFNIDSSIGKQCIKCLRRYWIFSFILRLLNCSTRNSAQPILYHSFVSMILTCPISFIVILEKELFLVVHEMQNLRYVHKGIFVYSMHENLINSKSD